MYKQNDSIRKLLNIDKWHAAGITGRGINIVVLDGADGKPRKFQQSYLTDVFGKSTKSGHGSNVAQVIHEFAPDAKIFYFDITRNKDAVFDWVKTHKDEIHFINVSMAGIGGMLTPDYLRYESLGIPVFCASGNDGYTDHISYPARYDFTIAVGATGKDGKSVDSYSNRGPKLNFVSTSHVSIMNDDGDIWAPSGTSYADPTAVATMALYEQWRMENGMSKITTKDVMDYVDDDGSCIDMYEPGRDDRSGEGLLILPTTLPVFEKGDDTMKIRPCPITLIDYHHSAGNEANAQQIREEHMGPPNNWGDIGYNMVIRKNGTIEYGRDVKYSGAHDPGPAPDGSGYKMNDRAYAICCIGNFETENMSEAQYQGLLRGAREVVSKYNIPITGHRRHNQQYQTECPGDNFPWSRLINDLTNKEVEDEMDVAIVKFSSKDSSTADMFAEEFGNCAVFNRNASPAVNPDVMKAKKIIIIGGPDIPSHPNRIYLSGEKAKHTAKIAADWLVANTK